MDDLSKEIKMWWNAGCDVILGVDTNEDSSAVESKSFGTSFDKLDWLKLFWPDTLSILQRPTKGTPNRNQLMVSSLVLVFQCLLADIMSLMVSSHRIIGFCGLTLISRYVWGDFGPSPPSKAGQY